MSLPWIGVVTSTSRLTIVLTQSIYDGAARGQPRCYMQGGEAATKHDFPALRSFPTGHSGLTSGRLILYDIFGGRNIKRIIHSFQIDGVFNAYSVPNLFLLYNVPNLFSQLIGTKITGKSASRAACQMVDFAAILAV